MTISMMPIHTHTLVEFTGKISYGHFFCSGVLPAINQMTENPFPQLPVRRARSARAMWGGGGWRPYSQFICGSMIIHIHYTIYIIIYPNGRMN